MKRVRSLVRNFNWSGQRDKRTWAKVRWNTIIQPVSRGGVKFLDPINMTKALLAKLVSRGLSLDLEP